MFGLKSFSAIDLLSLYPNKHKISCASKASASRTKIVVNCGRGGTMCRAWKIFKIAKMVKSKFGQYVFIKCFSIIFENIRKKKLVRISYGLTSRPPQSYMIRVQYFSYNWKIWSTFFTRISKITRHRLIFWTIVACLTIL